MSVGSLAIRAAAALAIIVAMPSAAAAQEAAVLKGGVAVSRLTGHNHWDEQIVATSFGGGVRFRFGFLTLQPELHVVTKGATSSRPEDTDPSLENEWLRLEYIELPVLLVLPAQVGDLELSAFGGPALTLESRCRFVFRQDGLRTNAPCDPPFDPVFRRNSFDYGLTAGAGISHRLFGGRVSLEGRHTWGMRNVNDNAALGEVRNRTYSVLLGYSMGWIRD